MEIKTFVCNMLEENCYVVSDETKECVIIDCGAFYGEERDAIVRYIDNNQLKPVHLLATHGHLDHNFGNNTILEHYGLKPEVAEGDRNMMNNYNQQAQKFYGMQLNFELPEAGSVITDNQDITFGNHKLKKINPEGLGTLLFIRRTAVKQHAQISRPFQMISGYIRKALTRPLQQRIHLILVKPLPAQEQFVPRLVRIL